ncbi:MAG: cytidine/deoxycytidylate deaminase family protein [Thermoplasmataceae archaeon]
MSAKKRPTWDEYFMRMAFLAASRTNCIRRSVGAVIVRDNHVIATGYNGPPSGLANCSDVGCIREDMGIRSGERHELCRGLHAEQNAIIQAAVYGSSIKNAKIYVTTHPCVVCAKMIINATINEIIYAEGYPDELSELIFIESGIKRRRFALPPEEIEAVMGTVKLQPGED